MKLARRMNRIRPSATLAITAKAKAMKARGIDVVGFGAGEPDFDTPDHIKEAAVRAIKEGFTKYTPVSGIEELKEAIAERAEAELGIRYETSQVIVSCGAKQAIYNAVMALFEEGDQVLVPSPCWVSYPEILAMAGAEAVLVPTEEEDGFKLKPEVLAEFITPRVKGIILNSPCNPTGSVYTQEEMDSLAEFILKGGLTVISDDVYDKLVYDGLKPGHIVRSSPELAERTVVINGVSKTYAMTGWRIGYALGPKEIITAMDTVQGQSTSNPTSIAQKAAVAALRGPQECVERMVREFQKRRDQITQGVNGIHGVSCVKPQGAFYVFANIGQHLGKEWAGGRLETSSDLAAYLLEEAKVAVVAGEPFGSTKHIRLSFALSEKEITKGIERISEALRALEERS
jgi:aspartate aminotransferase